MNRLQQIDLSKIRAQNISTVIAVGKDTWYQTTEEYKEWIHRDTSDFLWFKGRSGTGKTSEITRILRHFDKGKSDLVDTIAYFCPRMSPRTNTILRSIAIQLGHKFHPRVDRLNNAQKYNMESLFERECSTSVGVLWNLVRSLLQPYSGRKVCLFLDGIDALHPEDLEDFATNLHCIWSNIRSELSTSSSRDCWFKVLISSRPNIELAEILGNVNFVDPDTERSGSYSTSLF